MKKIFYILLFGLSSQLLAQNVGIGTATPDASAKLEVSDTQRGILIPRVALTATNSASPVTAPAASLLVYNTATSGSGATAVTPGYYYWDGTQWVRLLTTQSNDWSLIGNAGTNPTTNFIGTTDAVDFAVRTNNTEKMRVTSGGNVGIGTTTPPSRLTIGNNLATGALDNFNEYQILLWQNGTATTSYGMGIRSGTLIFNTDSDIHFDEDGVTRVAIDNSNVGIGTTTPAVRLHVPTGNIYGGQTIRATAPSDGINAGILETYNETNGTLWHITHRSGDADKLIFWRNNGTWANVLTLTMDQQVGVGTTGPDASAILDVSSTTKGVLLPRMTTAQRDAIPVSTARQGLLIYNTDRQCFEYFDVSANPYGAGGFWNSLCDHCDQVVIISTNQTGFNLNSYVGGAQAKTYCVYVQTGVTLQAAGNGGGSGVAGNPGFNATTMPLGAKVFLYNRGSILAGGGNGGQGGREGDGVCQGDINGQNGGAGGDAIVTNSNVPLVVYNYGTIRAGGGGGGGGRGGCCSAGGGGGGGAGTPAGTGGAGNSASCVRGFVCGCSGVATSGSGGNGTALTGGTGVGGACSGGSGCPGTGSGCGSTGGNGGVPGVAGNNGLTDQGCCAGGCTSGTGGAAGLALRGNGSGSSLTNISGTVTGAVAP